MKALLKNKFILLFVSIILFLIVPAFIVNSVFLKFLVVFILLAILLFQSVLVVFNNKKYAIIGIVFGLLALVASWIAYYYPYEVKILLTLADSLFFLFFLFIIIILISHLIKIKKVEKETIIIASSIYFLLGIIGGFIFEICYHLIPNSLSIPTDISMQVSDFVYFSFTTMTTLGYGDITPTVPQTQTIAILLSVIGQLYLTIVVALLIGTYISRKK
ncbi:ion channel [Bacteroidota bacterium]